MMTRWLLVAFTFSLLFAETQAATPSTSDSLLRVLNTAANDTVRMGILFRLSEVHSNFQERHTFAQRAESLAQIMSKSADASARLRGLQALVRVYNSYSRYYRQQFNHAQSKIELQRALELSQFLNDSVLIANSFVSLGLNAYESAEYDSAVSFAKQAKAIATRIQNDNILAAAGVVMANTFAATSQFGDALREYYRAIDLRKELVRKARETNNDSLVRETVMYLGLTYRYVQQLYKRQGDYERALKIAKESIAMSLAVNRDADVVGEYLSIADIYAGPSLNYDSALVYLDKLNELSTRKNDIWALSTVLERKGFIFLARGELERALKIQQDGLIMAFDIGDLKGIADGYSDVASVYEAMGATSARFYDSAMVYYNKALHDYRQLNGEQLLTSTYVSIAQMLRKQGRYRNSKEYILKALPGLRATRSRKELRDAFQLLSTCDSAMHLFESAYRYLQQSLLYADSVNKDLSDKEYQRVQFHADLESVEQSLKREQEAKDAESQQELDRQKSIRNGVLAVAFVLSAFFFVVLRQRNRIKREKAIADRERERSDELLRNILPAETAQELKETGSAAARSFEHVTVLFTDFKDFTRVSEQLTPEELVEEINYCYSAFDEISSKYGIEKIKTIGDSYMCAGGLPVASATHAQDVVMAACEIRDFMLREQQERSAAGKFFFECRIGVHSGPVVAGIVGIKKFAYDIWGDTVNIASRMQSSGVEGKVNISEATYELVKNEFRCIYRGLIPIKNRGEIASYFVE